MKKLLQAFLCHNNWLVTRLVRLTIDHPRFEKFMEEKFSNAYEWLYYRREWLVGRAMGDGPDEYYFSWPEFMAFRKRD